MPLYDYRCEKGHRYERREPFGSPTSHPCEKCGLPAQRVLHAPSISFKGSGWYKTDSRGSRPVESESKSSSNGTPSAKSSAKSSSKSSDGASKSGKPAEKSTSSTAAE